MKPAKNQAALGPLSSMSQASPSFGNYLRSCTFESVGLRSCKQQHCGYGASGSECGHMGVRKPLEPNLMRYCMILSFYSGFSPNPQVLLKCVKPALSNLYSRL